MDPDLEVIGSGSVNLGGGRNVDMKELEGHFFLNKLEAKKNL